MGILNSTSSSGHRAEKLVIFRGDSVATSVKLIFDSALPHGKMEVESSLRRLSGVGVSCVVERNSILVVRISRSSSRSSSESIHVSNTGSAKVSGGGVANTGYYDGRSASAEALPVLPTSVDYRSLANRGEEDIWLEHGSSSLVTIRTADPEQPYVINPL